MNLMEAMAAEHQEDAEGETVIPDGGKELEADEAQLDKEAEAWSNWRIQFKEEELEDRENLLPSIKSERSGEGRGEELNPIFWTLREELQLMLGNHWTKE